MFFFALSFHKGDVDLTEIVPVCFARRLLCNYIGLLETTFLDGKAR